jgi:hypothetical protein
MMPTYKEPISLKCLKNMKLNSFEPYYLKHASTHIKRNIGIIKVLHFRRTANKTFFFFKIIVRKFYTRSKSNNE